MTHSPAAPDLADPRLAVDVRAEILSVLGIAELAGSWQTKLQLQLSWRDERLQFQNLKQNNNLNLLTSEERGDIWIPEVGAQ